MGLSLSTRILGQRDDAGGWVESKNFPGCLDQNDCTELVQVPMILYLRGWNEMAVGHGEAKLGWIDNAVLSVSDENWKAR
jgi:hypothetical protein